MTDSFSLKNKHCAVTGSAGLIGQNMSRAILEAGGSLILIDMHESALSQQKEELQAQYPESSIASACLDITDKNKVKGFVDSLSGNPLDVLVNNAALNDTFKEDALQESMFENYSMDMWNQSLNANLTSVFLMSQAVGSMMKDAGGGSIVNVSSTYGLVAPDQSLYQNSDGEQMFYKGVGYPVTKAGVIALTRYCAAYWGAHNVRVNALCPGGVENEQNPDFVKSYSKRTMLGKMAQPDDYNSAVVFLASNASAYMTGSVMVVDGGWTAW